MPVSFSAKKALRRDLRRRAVNKKIVFTLKKQIAQFRKKPTKQALSKTYQLLDRAIKKKVIHPNKGARLKSTLASKLTVKK